MSRVDNDSPPSAQEAERAQKESDKRTRDAKNQETDRQTFGKLLSSQKQSKETQGQQGKQQAEANKGEQSATAQQKGASDADRAGRLSRGGTLQHSKAMEQAKGFQGALAQTQQKSGGEDQGRVQRRDVGKQKDKIETDDRQGDQPRGRQAAPPQKDECSAGQEDNQPRGAIAGVEGGQRVQGGPALVEPRAVLVPRDDGHSGHSVRAVTAALREASSGAAIML